jgi:hypothetical protein
MSYQLSARLGRTLDDPELHDVTFRFETLDLEDGCDDDGRKAAQVKPITSTFSPLNKLSAHKLILASGSPVFRAMFFGPLAEQSDVVINDATRSAFEKMVRYLYTDDANNSLTDVVEVMRLADKYDVEGLRDTCTSYVITNLTRDHAIDLYHQAAQFYETDVLKDCLDIMDRHAHYIINKNDQVIKFDRDLLRQVLTRDTFCAREIDIFDALLWWARENLPKEKHTAKDQREFLGDLLFLVRFPQMTMKELIKIVTSKDILEPFEMMEALRHTMGSPDKVSPTTMFPTKRRCLGIETIVKASDLSLTNRVHLVEGLEVALPDQVVGFERVRDRGLRLVRFKVDRRLFLKRVGLTNVPNRFSADGYRVVVKILDTIINEVVNVFEFELARKANQPPTPAEYMLDIDPVELCPKIWYELEVSIEGPEVPKTKRVPLMDSANEKQVVLLQYYGRCFNDEAIIDELLFMS